MKKSLILKFGLFALFLVLISSSVCAICVVKGQVMNQDGTFAQEGTAVNLTIGNSSVSYFTITGGAFPNFYAFVQYDCVAGDKVKALSFTRDKFGEASGIVTTPYTDLNITLNKDIQSLPSSPSGSGSSGGGGGSSKSTTISTNSASLANQQCTTVKIIDTIPFEIKECDKGSYMFKGAIQDFKLILVKEDFVGGLFSPLDAPIALFLNNKKKFDLDSNGAPDTEMALLSLNNGKAKLVFSKIKEIFPEKPPQATPVPSNAPVAKPLALPPSTEAPSRLDSFRIYLHSFGANNIFQASLALIILANLIILSTQIARHLNGKPKRK